MDNYLKSKFLLFNYLNNFNSKSKCSIIKSINIKQKILDKNINILDRIGNEYLNLDDIEKIKQYNELTNSNVIQNSSCPNINSINNLMDKNYYRSLNRRHIRNEKNKNKNYDNYINTSNYFTLNTTSSVNNINLCSFSNSLNDSKTKSKKKFFLKNHSDNKIKNIRNYFHKRDIDLEDNIKSFFSIKQLLKVKSVNKLNITKLNFKTLNKNINTTIRSSKKIENNIENYIKTSSSIEKKQNKPTLYHDFNQIKKTIRNVKFNKRIKTHFYNKKTGRNELIEINNGNIMRYCDNINCIRDNNVSKWGNQILTNYTKYEKKIDNEKKENETKGNKYYNRLFVRKQFTQNLFKLNKKVVLLVNEKNKFFNKSEY